MANLSKLSRRDFFLLTGVSAAGLGLYAAFKGKTPQATPSPMLASSDLTATGYALNLFVHIAPNNRVTLVAHRSEMGQGIRTSLPQVLADELDADWDKIDVQQAQGDQRYGDQNTDGSNSIRKFYQPMRELGASAKLMLRQAAAAQWQVPLEACEAKDHRVTHTASGKSLSYGELALAAAKLPVPDAKQLVFKSPEAFKYIGKPVAMVDFADIVRGSTHYGIDTVLPDLVYASIERCPVYGGGVKSFDASKALQVPGVLQVIKMDNNKAPVGFKPLSGVAVIASNTWAAMEGRKALVITWDTGEHAQFDSRATIAKLASDPIAKAKVIRERGAIEQAFASAAKTHEAVYTLPHLEHATLEPPSATAKVTGDSCEIWACLQNPVGAQELIADLLGFSQAQVTVNVTLLGGAFGRKSKPDFAAEAAVLAKAIGKPVKVTWSREDTTRNGYYHAYSVQHYKAALDANHAIIGLDSNVASPSIASLTQSGGEFLQKWELDQGFSTVPYDVPHLRARNSPAPVHTRIGWMRSVYHLNHAFAINSFIDELARLNKLDPLDYHLAAIGADRIVNTGAEGEPVNEKDDFAFSTQRLKNAIQRVRESSGWPAAVAANRGWGFAVHRSFETYVAVATQIQLDAEGLRVLEVHLAVDCGQIVNPDRVRSQMEGAIIFGLSSALFGEISFKNGAVEQSSFDNYALLRIQQTPKIVVTLIDSDKKHTGAGEPGVTAIAASVTNAIVSAGGPRIRQLPIKNHLKIA